MEGRFHSESVIVINKSDSAFLKSSVIKDMKASTIQKPALRHSVQLCEDGQETETEANQFAEDDSKKVMTEIVEVEASLQGSLAGLEQDTSVEVFTSGNRKSEYGEFESRDSKESSSQCGDRAVKENTRTKVHKRKQVQKSNTNIKTRTRSQKLVTVQSKNKLKTRLKGKTGQFESIGSETAVEDRYNESSEPEIAIHCKAKYIKLKPISKNDLEGRDLYVEIEIDKDLLVSPIEKIESSSAKKSKYSFKVSSVIKTTEKQSKNKTQIVENMSNVKKSNKRTRTLKNETEKQVKADSDTVGTARKKAKRKQSISMQPKQSSCPAIETVDDCKNHIGTNPVQSKMVQVTADNNVHGVLDNQHTDNESTGELPFKSIDKDDLVIIELGSNKSELRQQKKAAPRKKKSNKEKKKTKSIEYSTRITEDGEKFFGCPVCNYESKYSQNIRSHYLIHTNVKPWICEICGSAFVSKCNLRHHMISHSNDRPFKCPTCGLGFKQKVVLQQHVARHNEDRQFVCDQCGKGFCISGDLKKHIRTHTGEKPYKCEVCTKQFSDNSSLARHRYLHNEAKNFSCPICEKKFSRQDMCNSHMKTHNGDSGARSKTKKLSIKRTKKTEVVSSNVIEEPEKMESEQRDLAPREHLYHIENYAKEIQERSYTEMDVATRGFTVTNYPQQQQQQQHQAVQVYPQRTDPNVQQESYPRDYTSMWTSLHFY